MEEKLKLVVTVLGLLGGLLALAERAWKVVVWLATRRTRRADRAWAEHVREYLDAVEKCYEGGRPRDATFYFVDGSDGPEKRCIVAAHRERAAQHGIDQGFFLSERDAEGRLVVRLRIDRPPRGESIRNTLRRAYDVLAEKNRSG